LKSKNSLSLIELANSLLQFIKNSSNQNKNTDQHASCLAHCSLIDLPSCTRGFNE
jgi:hypothetical protein